MTSQFVKRPITLSVLLAITISIPFFVGTAIGAVINVNSSSDVIADDGVCTLREAIINANSDSDQYGYNDCTAGSGADTINLPVGTYTLTILPDLTNDDCEDGDLDIAYDLTIIGAGQATTIIQAGTTDANGIDPGIDRVFHVLGDTAAVTFNAMTIRHGNAPSTSYGGGVFCESGNLVVNDSTVTRNCATYGGGGIYTDGIAVNITNSTISYNRTDSGGGGLRQVSGTLAITDSVVYDNNSSYGGGGININLGETELILTRCYIMNNTAQTSGGGISGNEAYGGSITITDSYIVNNQAGFYGFGGGGGISHGDASTSLTISNCTISNNEANYGGGGISSVTWGYAPQLTISDSTFAENHAGSAGGAIHTSSLFSITTSFFFRNISGYENDGQGGGGAINFPSNDAEGSISDCYFADNTAGLDGGGVHSYAIVSFANCIFSNNIAPNGSGDDICLAGGTMTSYNIILTSNLVHGIETYNICNIDPTQYLSILQGATD